MLGFQHAFRGLMKAFLSERNFKVEVVLFLFVVGAGIFFSISRNEWIAVLLVSALVFSLELMNTVIEQLCDLYSKEWNKSIKTIKDISASAVLIAAIFAAVIGIIIFYPYCIQFFG